MKYAKRKLSSSLNIILCLAVLLSATSCKAEKLNNEIRSVPVIDDRYFLSDIGEHWASNDIQNLLLMGVLKGYEDKTFRPSNSITRAEFITMLVRALYGEPLQSSFENAFDDVFPSDWYYESVHYARQMGLTNGKDGKSFAPKLDISREEIMLLVCRAVRQDAAVVEQDVIYKDVQSSYKYINELRYANYAGLIGGYDDNTFRPEQNASRAETAVIIRRTLNNYSERFKSDNDKKAASDKAVEYLKKYAEAKTNRVNLWEYGLENSAGKEWYYNTVRQSLYDYFKSENITIKQTVSDIKVSGCEEINSSEMKVWLSYNSRFNRQIDNTNREKTVYIQAEVLLKRLRENWQVYSVDDRICYNTPIRLVWEQVYSSAVNMDGVYHMQGLDVISPMWFRVSKQASEDSTPISESMHFVDYSNGEFVKNAHKSNYDIWAMFKSDFEPAATSEYLADDGLKSKSFGLLIKQALSRSVDGINLDFENMNVSDKDRYSYLVRQISFLCGEMGLASSVDVTKYHQYSGNWSLCYDRTALGRAVDYVCLMAYDQNPAGSKTAGSVADIPWVEDSINLTLGEVSKEKLLLGVPFYARLWQTQDGKVVKSSALTMDTAQSVIAENSASIVYDEQTGQNYANWEKDGSTYQIWIEDETSISARIELMKKYGLPGIAVWSRVQGNENIWKYIDKNIK